MKKLKTNTARNKTIAIVIRLNRYRRKLIRIPLVHADAFKLS